MNTLTIDLSRLDPSGESLSGRLDAAILELSADDDLVRPDGPVCFTLHVERVVGDLLVRGRVDTTVRCACSRCAEWFTLAVREPDFFFDASLADTDDFVDLTSPVREAIILALPAFPLCGADCRGLCPQCGTNRNHSVCDCAPPSDRRWSALEALDPGSDNGVR